MKIIPVISIHTKAGLFPPGSEVSLPDAEAQVLIAQDYAVPAPTKPKPKPPEGQDDKGGSSGQGGQGGGQGA